MPRTPLILSALIACTAAPSFATFHLMQIEEVIGGVDGDTNAQAIQLRMRATNEGDVQFTRIRAWDAAGANPVIVIDFGSPVTNEDVGDRILVATNEFLSLTTPACMPDFVMTNRIPASYLAAGSLTFEIDSGATIFWRLSWGGSSYTGSTLGSITNDLDGEFGPPWPGPLPSNSLEALLFEGAATDRSTNNADDYSLTTGPAVFTNNARTAFTLEGVLGVPGIVTPSWLVSRVEPNPLRVATRFSFDLAAPQRMTLGVWNAQGQEIARLEASFGAGRGVFEWDGRAASGARAPAGVYRYRLDGETATGTGTFVILR